MLISDLEYIGLKIIRDGGILVHEDGIHYPEPPPWADLFKKGMYYINHGTHLTEAGERAIKEYERTHDLS